MDFRKMPLAAAVLAVGLGVSCPLFAQVYKWTDDHGHVHFSDHAPRQQKTTTLDLPESTDPAPAPDLTEEQHKLRQKKLVKALEEDRLAEEKRRADAKAAVEKKKVYCERFRNRLARLDASSRVYSENKDGTVTYWKAGDADRYRQKQHSQYQSECQSN